MDDPIDKALAALAPILDAASGSQCGSEVFEEDPRGINMDWSVEITVSVGELRALRTAAATIRAEVARLRGEAAVAQRDLESSRARTAECIAGLLVDRDAAIRAAREDKT